MHANQPRDAAICVLGAHRSGTSAITRTLNILGVNLGNEEALVPATFDNPDGFWEHANIVRIQDEILGSLGYKWDTTLPLPDGWEERTHLDEYISALKGVVLSEFLGRGLWGWKDPRTCLLLPIWKKAIEYFPVDVCYLHVLRNPLEVADSLRRRNGFSMNRGLAIWFVYTLSALRGVGRGVRAFISYDKLFADPKSEVARALSTLGLSALCHDESSWDKVRAFIEPERRHSYVSTAKFQNADVPLSVKQLYSVCMSHMTIHHMGLLISSLKTSMTYM